MVRVALQAVDQDNGLAVTHTAAQEQARLNAIAATEIQPERLTIGIAARASAEAVSALLDQLVDVVLEDVSRITLRHRLLLM
jgi:hypothetical protein